MSYPISGNVKTYFADEYADTHPLVVSMKAFSHIHENEYEYENEYEKRMVVLFTIFFVFVFVFVDV